MNNEGSNKKIVTHHIEGEIIEITPELMGHVLIEVTARLTKQGVGLIYESLDAIVLAQYKKLLDTHQL